MFDVIWKSCLLVTATEMGDKTQLLALVLASRYRKPWVIMAGILVATILNHSLAAWTGSWVSQMLAPETLRWILAASFFAFAAWVLIPDKDDEKIHSTSAGAFMVTLISFFFAEMGDKTQLSTVALAARYQDVLWVTVGTTMGMLVADGLAVFMGDKITERIPMKWMRLITCGLFIVFGVIILLQTSWV
jgi:putative Ca2+/H+ antiporter (TMEM165/GDT1 family)